MLKKNQPIEKNNCFIVKEKCRVNEKCTKIPKTLSPDTSKAMYKHNIRRTQLPLFSMPFGEHLSPDNKWVRLAKLVPWDEIEDKNSPGRARGLPLSPREWPLAR
ncbi:hypothetical protein LJC22_01105 [Desulfosarcina sp. OttesenSCG-928-G10]|nr:hypothetical protein [Desulfosarcina sp. OttesenSCG-928-G10]